MDEAAGGGIRIVYTRRYNIRAFGLEKLHPFDSQKYGRAFRRLKHRFGDRLRKMWVRLPRACTRDELLRIHTPEYLKHLADSTYVARALEVPQAASFPGRVLDWCVLRPMRWGTMGTIVAAREAMAHGLAINLSGGITMRSPTAEKDSASMPTFRWPSTICAARDYLTTSTVSRASISTLIRETASATASFTTRGYSSSTCTTRESIRHTIRSRASGLIATFRYHRSAGTRRIWVY
jgi:hypothetical protein